MEGKRTDRRWEQKREDLVLAPWHASPSPTGGGEGGLPSPIACVAHTHFLSPSSGWTKNRTHCDSHSPHAAPFVSVRDASNGGCSQSSIDVSASFSFRHLRSRTGKPFRRGGGGGGK